MNIFREGQKEFRREMKANGVRVTLKWKENMGGTVHPTTGALVGGTSVVKTETVQGFFLPMDAKTQVRLFNEVREGMGYLDLPAETVVDGREQLVFEVGASSTGPGQTWVQDKAGEKVIEHFDTVTAAGRYCRTVMVRLQS
jgi:hypothetical protein